MAHIIALANQKGEVGKTTSAVNLAHALHGLGQSVLAVDLALRRRARWLEFKGTRIRHMTKNWRQ